MPTTMSDREIQLLYSDAKQSYLARFTDPNERRVRSAEVLAQGLPEDVLASVRAKLPMPPRPLPESHLPSQLIPE
jgi:hypothetical protein